MRTASRISNLCLILSVSLLAACGSDSTPGARPVEPRPVPPIVVPAPTSWTQTLRLSGVDSTGWGAMQITLRTAAGRIDSIVSLTPDLVLVREDSLLIVLGNTRQQQLQLRLVGPVATAGVTAVITSIARPDGSLLATPTWQLGF